MTPGIGHALPGRTLAAAAIATVLALPAGAANAAVVFTGFHTGSASVPIVLDGNPRSVSAGELDVKIDNVLNTSFCIEIPQSLGFNTSYGDYALEPASGRFNPTQLDEFSRLFQNHLGLARTSGTYSAAFQVAVWEITYDGAGGFTGLDLSNGRFSDTALATGTPGAIAKGWLDGLHNESPGAWSFQWLRSDTRQDQLVGHVPVPATAALMGIGFAGLGVRRGGGRKAPAAARS